ncbi:MAG TPA: hypothetical protein VD789_08945 [Thermomicrobiales bacterium]|nr:hypothetical protein [Thermomicrobiales bacterium]
MTKLNRVVIETGSKKVFASALDWPGWSRSGRTEHDALQTLADYADRYHIVASLAGLDGVPEIAKDLDVVEHCAGSGATDFGVPERVAECERDPMTEAECERQLALLRACWRYFDDVASRVSAELRKGPRGGGRDRDRIIDHVVQADRGYGRQIGVRTPAFDSFDGDAVRAHREAIYAVIPMLRNGEPGRPNGWPVRYFIRRAAWHVLDHAWEMEDKDLTGRET